MITFSKLGNMGRLGNQLWQLSATICAAINNNDSYGFAPWKYEPDFNLHEYFLSNIKIFDTYTEPYFHYAPIPNQSNLDLVGYFQSYKYMLGHENFIKEKLTPIHHFDKEPGLCSIHVRRGDYVSIQDCHPLVTMNYYNKAMEMSGCNKFLVFSDDINWCKDNFRGNMFEFSENTNPAIDLALMAKKCEHNIICNSSFSWWGGWLNKTANKKVICPTQWFGHKLPHNTNDMCPTDWLKI